MKGGGGDGGGGHSIGLGGGGGGGSLHSSHIMRGTWCFSSVEVDETVEGSTVVTRKIMEDKVNTREKLRAMFLNWKWFVEGERKGKEGFRVEDRKKVKRKRSEESRIIPDSLRLDI